MGIGTSVLLIAAGAIMRFATTAHTSGFSIQTAGLILMIVGVVGLVMSVFWMTIWADRRRGAIVAERPVVRERDVY